MGEILTIKDYIKKLEKCLEDADPAITADALDDAEEHLTELITDIAERSKIDDMGRLVKLAIRQYGNPKTIAKEYIKQDKSYKKRIQKKREERRKGLLGTIFGVYADSVTYRSLLYLFLMFPLGIIYFTYIVTGLSLSLGLIVTIIGLPLLALFLLSISPISFFHGRLTEKLLGIRMPRKRRKYKVKGKLWKRVWTILKNPKLYTSMLYMLLIFPLGIIYFTLIVTFFAVAIALIGAPIIYLLNINGLMVGVLPGPAWFQAVTMLLGFAILTWTMHLVSILGRLHGRMSKRLLIGS